MSPTPKPTRRLPVADHLPPGKRGCLFCLLTSGPFTAAEHAVPRNFGPDTDRFVLPPGVVCDRCNHWLGRQVDGPFADRFDMKVSRALEELSGRVGAPPVEIKGRDVTSRLDVESEGRKVTLFASRVERSPEGHVDIEVRPVQRSPHDILARTLRALWKITLGCPWLARGDESLDPRWDHLRRVVLGAPMRGYVLQQPFSFMVTRRLAIEIDANDPTDPCAIIFALGGVVLAAPIAPGRKVSIDEVRAQGWEIWRTDRPASDVVHLRLEDAQLVA